MSRKILLITIALAFLISGCSWHIPFFGSKKAQEEEPLVQEATQVEEKPQYSGINQPLNQAYSNPYAAPPAGYGQPNTNYALNAASGYGAADYNYQGQGAGQMPYYGGSASPAVPAYNQYGAQPPAAATYGASPQQYGVTAPAYNQYAAPQGADYGAYPVAAAPAQSNSFDTLGGNQAQESFFGSPGDINSFSGIKRKVLFLISYPQRGLSSSPQDNFSRNIYQRLAAASGLNLVPQEAINQITNSPQFFNQSLDIRSRLSQLGQELGAQAIILEKVVFATDFNASPAYGYQPPSQRVELQLIDTASGYPVKSYNLNPAADGAEKVVDALAAHIHLIDWSARVIKVEKDRLLINAGRLSGLQNGQNLRIYAKASEIKDPQSKLSLGQAQGALKGTVKVIDFFGLDGAICEPLAAGKFAENDMVKAVE